MKTTKENIRARLCLRFGVTALSALLVACLWGQGAVAPLHAVELFAFLPIPLTLLAPLLSVPNTYLTALSLFYGGYQGILLASAVRAVRTGISGILPFNAALLLIFFSLFLFLYGAAKACQFSFENPARDGALFLKRAFLKYTVEAVLYTAVSVSVCFLWSKLLSILPI